MERESAENSGGQRKATSSVKQQGTPTSKVAVTRGNDRSAVKNRELIGRKREAKVVLREGGDSGAKGVCEIDSSVTRNSYWEEISFMVVDGETSGHLKVLQSIFNTNNSFRRGAKEFFFHERVSVTRNSLSRNRV